jgi:hypothetical protein
MSLKFKKNLKSLVLVLQKLGLDLFKTASLKNYFRYRRNKREWINKGGKITCSNMVLSDYEDKAGNNKGHYFHQDLLVANFIYENKPRRHIDIGSRIDGFVAHVASFREVEVLDIRPLERSKHKNIKFVQADLMNSQNLGETDSLSCLHAIEHFGLGRYNDPIDVDGHIKGIDNLVKLVSDSGYLYISFPIGKNDEIHFNAHRVFCVDSILKYSSIKENMKLVRFDYVDDLGNLHTDVKIQDVNADIKYGCGIYTFQKTINNK